MHRRTIKQCGFVLVLHDMYMSMCMHMHMCVHMYMSYMLYV